MVNGLEKEQKVESTQSENTKANSTPSNGKISKGGEKKKSWNENKRMKSKSNSSAAVASGVQVDTSTLEDGNKEGDSEIEIVTTRLVDNHPITPKDRNPRYYLSHLTEDKLEDTVPVFESDRSLYPDEFGKDVRVSYVDENGNEVVEIRHVKSTKEEGLEDLGFVQASDKMFGYHYGSNRLPSKNMDYPDEDRTTSSKTGSNEITNSKEVVNDELKQMDEDSMQWYNTPILPGSEMQSYLDQQYEIHKSYAQDIRREHRRMVLGYDNRMVGNSEPWVDTHRMEAIDARLHEVHLQRAAGELDYPIEKDAVEEAHRIFKEEEAALNTIEQLAKASEGKQVSFSTKGKKIQQRKKHRMMKKLAVEGDNELSSMDVDAIPVERLYEARRIELEKLRQTHYEDYDLNYLLEKSGKEMKSKKQAASLYEDRHGSLNKPSDWDLMNPVVGVNHLNATANEREKAILQQEVELYKKYGRMPLDQSLGLYRTDINIISPEMVDAMKEFCEEENTPKKEETPGLNNSMFANEQGSHGRTVKDLETRVKEEEKKIGYDGDVDKEMDFIHPDRNKPLEDIEVGYNEKKDVVVAKRAHPSKILNYQEEKLKFMKKFDDLLNEEIAEEDKKEINNLVLTQEDIEQQRAAVGIPKDVSNKEFVKKYIKPIRKIKNAGDMVSEVVTGYSLSNPDKILKDLKLETEQDIEDYLMDTFKAHKASQQDLMSPEEQETVRLLQEASRATKLAEKQIEEEKKEGEAPAEEKKDGESPATEEKKEGETATEEKKEGETATEEKKEGEAAPTEEKKEGEAVPEEKKEGETTTEEKKEDETTTETSTDKKDESLLEKEEIVDPYLSMSLEEAGNALATRLKQDQFRANMLASENPNELVRGHIVDALEYSDQVYVSEKNSEMIYKMYQEGINPKEISQSFGYDEGRVYAILRLMKNRESHKKEGTFSDKPVESLEASQDVFDYEYRDFPPADFKTVEKRKRVNRIPTELPKFVFLKEGDDEVKIMKEIDRLISPKRKEKDPEIKRQGLPVGKGKID